jgi:hypothetical protein
MFSDDPLDYSGKITLKTDTEKHPGMIFYELDDGKTKEQKVKEGVDKVLKTVVNAASVLFGSGSGVPSTSTVYAM